MKVSNELMGRQNKKVGQYFEMLISYSCDEYEKEGVAKIEKQNEPLEAIKPYVDRYGRARNGLFVACFKEKSGVDYKGTLKGGRSVVFEAKHTDSDVMKRDRLKEHQLEYLRRHEELGAICFVILSFGLQNYYKIPFSDWDNMKAVFGKVSVREKDIEKYKLKTISKRILFLEGIADG